MNELRFTVYGSVVSANRIRSPFQGRMRKTKDAREDAARVREIATVAASGWEIPPAASVEIVAWNSRIDADNVSKCLLDSIKGVAWRDDADVMDIRVLRRWDGEGERYEVVVRATDDLRPGRKPRKRKDVYAAGSVLTFEQRDALLRKVGIL